MYSVPFEDITAFSGTRNTPSDPAISTSPTTVFLVIPLKLSILIIRI